jgi:hypothetical protein
MKSQKRRRFWPTPGCNAMEEEEEKSDMEQVPYRVIIIISSSTTALGAL